MSSSSSSSASTDTTRSAVSPGRVTKALTEFYRQYIGEPRRKRDIYLGFGFFFAGIAFAAVGLLVFLYSGTRTPGSAVFWQLRQIALTLGFLGLPAFVFSIVILLPVGKRTRRTSSFGVVLCVIATAYLISVYPYQWTTPARIDGSVVTITIYAAGVVVLSASTGAALVAEYLDREAGERATTDEDSETTEETVTDEQVAADIEESMSNTELSWGGVEPRSNTERLSLDMPDIDTDQRDQLDETSATTTRSGSDTVDSAVDGLRKLQGGEKETARGASTEEQVDALTEFRERQEAQVETGVEENRGIVARIKALLFE